MLGSTRPDSSIPYSLMTPLVRPVSGLDLDKGDQLRFEVHASHLKTLLTFDWLPDGESIAVGYQDGSSRAGFIESASAFQKVSTTGQWPRLSIVRTAISCDLGEAGNRETSIIDRIPDRCRTPVVDPERPEVSNSVLMD